MGTLTGSEKQVAWATDLRDKWLAWAEAQDARESARRDPDEEFLAELTAAVDAARRNTSSKFWIENRSQPSARLMEALNGTRPFQGSSSFPTAYNPVFEDAPAAAPSSEPSCETCAERARETRRYQVGAYVETKLGHRYYVHDRTTVPLCRALEEPSSGTYLDRVHR